MARPPFPVILVVSFILLNSPLGIAATVAAGSPPAQVCAKSEANPVLSDSGPYREYNPTTKSTFVGYSTYYNYPYVLKLGKGLVMWFSGQLDNVSGIYRADSNDGIRWTVYPSVALSTGPNGTWDSGIVYSPSVVWNGSMYLMYYTATGTNTFRQMGVAFSRDGFTWTKYSGNPILVAGPAFYDSWWVRTGTVMFDGGVYEMWYTGHTLTNTTAKWYIAVDFASSNDGIHWVKYVGNPVYGGPDSWPYLGYQHPSVLKVNGTYLMVLDNGGWVLLAASQEGIHWRSSGSVLISPGSANSWDNGSIMWASAVVNGSAFLVWYTGFQYFPNESIWRGVGLAYCGLIPIELTRTVTATTISTFTSSALVTTTEVSTQTTTSTIVSSTTETISGIQVTVAATAGAIVALAIAIPIVWRVSRRRTI